MRLQTHLDMRSLLFFTPSDMILHNRRICLNPPPLSVPVPLLVFSPLSPVSLTHMSARLTLIVRWQTCKSSFKLRTRTIKTHSGEARSPWREAVRSMTVSRRVRRKRGNDSSVEEIAIVGAQHGAHILETKFKLKQWAERCLSPLQRQQSRWHICGSTTMCWTCPTHSPDPILEKTWDKWLRNKMNWSGAERLTMIKKQLCHHLRRLWPQRAAALV